VLITEKWPIDRAILAETAGVLADKLLPELIRLYLEDATMLLTKIQGGLQNQDLDQSVQAAHRLKGNSASMGITTMADLARKVEMAAKQNMADEATILSDQLAAEYAEVKPALAQILTEITT
jgi:HPt (histidine-containing phosphotransfer) domain-containing protein